MPLKFKTPLQPPVTQPAAPAFASGDDSPAPPPGGAAVERSVFCSHGIHNGHFPVQGLTVAEARRTLGGLLNIDPEAVAVIGGVIVPEDHVIDAETGMLSFVKKSSVKGSRG